MLTVYKYDVPVADAFSLDLPADARVLTVKVQGEQARLWALVDPDAPLTPRHFRLSGTGHSIEVAADALRYVGSFQPGRGLIFHLFVVLPLGA